MNLLDLLISSIVMGISIIFAVDKIKTEEVSNKRKIIFLIMITIFLFLNNAVIINYTNNSLKLFINYFASLCLFKIIYNQKNEDSIVNAFVITLFVVVGEFVYIAMVLMLQLDIVKLQEIPMYVTLTTIFVSIIMNLLVKVKIIQRLINLLRKVVKRNLIPVLFIFAIAMDILLFNNSIKNIFSIQYITNVFLFIIFLIIVYIILKEKFTVVKISEKYDHMEEDIKRYEQIINDQNKKSHEFKNQLAVINGYIDEKNMKAKEYIKTILIDTDEVDSFFMKEIVKIPSGGLKGLLYYKIYDIKKKKLNFDLRVEGKMVNLSNKLTAIQYKELTQVAGVLIDNAIQSAEKSNDKIVDIVVKSTRNKYCIKISNTYDKKFEYDKIGVVGFTTKGKNRGYGLRLVKDIIDKNDIFSVEKKLNNDMFTQKFEINFK